MTPGCTVMPAREQAPLGIPPFHRWTAPGGTVWTEFCRIGSDVVIRFPGFADFVLPPGNGATLCWPVPSLDDDTREHIFLNQVLPLVQGRSGRLSFHASAVATDRGAIAFVGRSGQGKSTLAAEFAANGCPFLTDDGLVLDDRAGEYLVEPSHPSIRLWDDSREALIGAEAERAGDVSYTRKARFLAGRSIRFRDSPVPLRVAYFLGEDEAGTPKFVPHAGADLLFGWVQHSFLLDLDEPVALSEHFSRLAAFSAAVPCYWLHYSRRYDRLAAVRRAVLQHLVGVTSG